MIVKVRLRQINGEIKNLEVKLPDDIRDYYDDTINDCVSDYLDENNIKYKWYRVAEIETDFNKFIKDER